MRVRVSALHYSVTGTMLGASQSGVKTSVLPVPSSYRAIQIMLLAAGTGSCTGWLSCLDVGV